MALDSGENVRLVRVLQKIVERLLGNARDK